MRILLTGGRAPATLELARHFQAAGHEVSMAESLRWPLTRPSKAIKRHFVVPPPKFQPQAYLHNLQTICQQQQIDWLIPTCEEIFYVAQGRADFPTQCTVWTEPLEKLRHLHNKWLFYQRSLSYGLAVPPTQRLSQPDDLYHLMAAPHELVFKPVYSRFASQTLICPRQTPHLDFTAAWVAQRFIQGRALCTYSLAHQGHLTAQAAYACEFTAGHGATLVFEAITHPAAEAWVRQFVQAEQFTGQIAFDFIEAATGQLFAIECNPRATNGLFLFRHHPDFTQAFFKPQLPCLTPPPQPPIKITLAMLLYALPACRSWTELGHWARTFWQSEAASFTWHDPAPALLQGLSIGQFLLWGLKYGLSPTAATTWDIEWNGF